MMYRIVEHQYNGKPDFFVPQYRFLWLFWKNWYTGVCMDVIGRVSFKTYEEALDYIKRDIEGRKATTARIVHEVSV